VTKIFSITYRVALSAVCPRRIFVTEIRKIIKELVQRLQASNDTGTQLTPDGDSGEVSNPQCEVMQTNIDSSTVKQ
jgi:hypothetical protein